MRTTGHSLKRIVGTPTVWLLGMGVAIGSGIFRTPGTVARHVDSPTLILLAWLLGGVVVLMQGLVTAELATRFPRAGGEYVFLKETYGEFAGFFFGWAYTIFIIGAGAAAIAAALGDFTCELLDLDGTRSPAIAATTIVVVTGVNALGLRTGAHTQNALTLLKVAALLVLVISIFGWSEPASAAMTAPTTGPSPTGWTMIKVFLAAMIPVLWPYDGTTDSVKLAEEVRDVRRALPRAIIGSTVTITVLYVLVNAALLHVLSPKEMAAAVSVPGEAMGRVFGEGGRRAMLLAAIVACLGSLSSTILATIRVTFALARDGLTFRFLARMSSAQSPVNALLIVGGLAATLVLLRRFEQVLGIYFFAAAILFGLSYASLIVLRLREREVPKDVFRCPGGMVIAACLILLQIALAVSIAFAQGYDTLYTAALLIALALLYFVWKRVARPAAAEATGFPVTPQERNESPPADRSGDRPRGDSID